ncbi:MAG: YhdP family protein [Alcanivoracaceae bacterium]|nr:YhdP family protein [Alcanivoracaceae bacterium]
MTRQRDQKHRRNQKAQKLRGKLLMAVSAVVLLMAAWVVIGRQIMMMVPDYRHDLETLIEGRINTPLEIETLSGHMDGATPVFVFENVRLPIQGSETPLIIERVELSVDIISSLVNRNLRARQLLVSGIALNLTLDENNRVHLTGLEGLGSAQQPKKKAPIDALLDLIYRQKRLVVENASGVLTLQDMPPVLLEELTAAVVSSGSEHRLSMRARTKNRPIEIDVRMIMQGDAHSMAEVNAKGYAHFKVAEADAWINAAIPGDIQLENINGDIEAWLSINGGKVGDAALNFAFDHLDISGQPLMRPLSFSQLNMKASLHRRADQYQIQLGELAFDQGGHNIALSSMAGMWNGLRGDESRWQVAARDFSVAPLREWTLSVPIDWPEKIAPIKDKLTQLIPSAEFESVALSGEGKSIAAISARFQNIYSKAHEKIPGVNGVSGWLAGSLEKGVIKLDSPELSLDLPLMFRQPLVVDARGPVRWKQTDEGIIIETGWLKAEDPHARGQAVATARLQPGEVPNVSLIASLADGDAKEALRYIPLEKLPEPVADWLADAFVDGWVETGALIHEGPVKIDPDRQQDHTLQVAINARDLTLHFLPGWPDITKLSANVTVDGREIRGRNISGMIFDSKLENASADVPGYIGDEAPQLYIHSRVTGPAKDLQSLFQKTPLTDVLPSELQDWQVSEGGMRGNALLYVPLKSNSGPIKVRVISKLTDAALENEKRQLHLSKVSGDVSFTLADGVQAPSLTAVVWDRPVQASVSSADQRTRIDFKGTTTAQSLQDWLQAKWLAPAQGDVGYDAELLLPGKDADADLSVAADLSAVALKLPAPLEKHAGDLGQATFSMTSKGDEQDISFDHSQLFSARLRLKNQAVERGQVLIGGEKSRMPNEPGVFIGGHVGQFPVKSWIDFFSASRGDELGEKPFPLRRISLRADKFDLFDLPIADAVLRVNPEGEGWLFAVDSNTLVANVSMPANFTARGPEPLGITLQQVVLTSDEPSIESVPTNSSDGVSPAEEKPEKELMDIDPRDIPTMNLSVESVVIDNLDYGQWRFSAKPTIHGVKISNLVGNIRGADIKGHVNWEKQSADAVPQSHFVGSLDTRNVASMLKQWDMPPVIESNKLRSLMDLTWPGSPLDIDYLSLHGKASLEIGESRFPKTDSKTSALRVLGVFNLGTVSRRLRFDFSDLYKKGLTCDSIGGDFQFDGPALTTENLVIKSPSAEFRVKGKVNMETESLDHNMEVILPVSSNLYVGCLAGPTACAGIFVVERLWGNRLEKMTSLGYHVTGSLDDPKVEEVQGMFERSK